LSHGYLVRAGDLVTGNPNPQFFGLLSRLEPRLGPFAGCAVAVVIRHLARPKENVLLTIDAGVKPYTNDVFFQDSPQMGGDPIGCPIRSLGLIGQRVPLGGVGRIGMYTEELVFSPVGP
jgi:hypothetical protein